MNVLFLGYGRMGGALGEAWLKNKLISRLIAVDPVAKSSSAECYTHVDELPDIVLDLIVIAVKPQYVGDALTSLGKRHLDHSTLVISVAAGVQVDVLRRYLPKNTPVMRVMPNTPVLVSAGCTGMFAQAGTLTPTMREQITPLFSAVGTAYWVEKEDQLDIITALSGSGPAYFHLFCEALCDAGVRMGLSRELSRNVVVDTAWGAAILQRQQESDFATLRRNVTSPKGTTAAAIAIFEEHDALRNLVLDAAEAARQRSQELSKS
jgi:pyrroline-5-carboxylate reductase